MARGEEIGSFTAFSSFLALSSEEVATRRLVGWVHYLSWEQH